MREMRLGGNRNLLRRGGCFGAQLPLRGVRALPPFARSNRRELRAFLRPGARLQQRLAAPALSPLWGEGGSAQENLLEVALEDAGRRESARGAPAEQIRGSVTEPSPRRTSNRNPPPVAVCRRQIVRADLAAASLTFGNRTFDRLLERGVRRARELARRGPGRVSRARRVDQKAQQGGASLLPRGSEGVMAASGPRDSALLTCVPLFERLNEEERSLLAAQLPFPRAACSSARASRATQICIVASGEVEIFRRGPPAAASSSRPPRPQLFGELSLLDGDRPVSSKTLKEDRGDVELLFSRHPAAAMDILAAMGGACAEADKLLAPGAGEPERGDRRAAPAVQSPHQASVAAFSGTFAFLLLHVIWFVVWLAVNSNMVPGTGRFDPYPYQFLHHGRVARGDL